MKTLKINSFKIKYKKELNENIFFFSVLPAKEKTNGHLNGLTPPIVVVNGK
jgi:hypothetical protein